MKKFFEKAKLEYKFKKAGEGHTLEEDGSASSRQQASSSQMPAARAAPSSDAQRAGLVSMDNFKYKAALLHLSVCGHQTFPLDFSLLI